MILLEQINLANGVAHYVLINWIWIKNISFVFKWFCDDEIPKTKT